MEKVNTIVCFTASYPYGMRETYFENELKFLCERFERVFVVPTYNRYTENCRLMPPNAVLCDVMLPQGKARIFEGLRRFRFVNKLFKEFFASKVFLNSVRLKNWGNEYLIYCIGIRYFRSLNFDQNRTVLYSYWAGMPFFVEKEFASFRKVVRMHGADFYQERNFGYLPLRKEIYSCADLLLPISRDIAIRLIEQYKVKKDKLQLSYLGVENTSELCKVNFSRGVLKVISCSNVYPLKRVELIFETLNFLKVDVEWTHIGGGESLEELKFMVSAKQNSRLKVTFKGLLNQEEIKREYSENYYDLFINTSRYEGLPVSIMEAFSYGIPALATDVGGTSEIVDETNGLIVDVNFSCFELASKIEEEFRSGQFLRKRLSAYTTWLERFNADRNYSILVNKLKNIKK